MKKPVCSKRFVVCVLLIISVVVFLDTVGKSETGEVIPENYTITISCPFGSVRTIEEVVSHSLIPEDNPVFLSVLVEDGRRFLFSIMVNDFEFSKELNRLIEMEVRSGPMDE